MTSRAIDDPTAAGWVEVTPGFWEYSGGVDFDAGIEEAPEDSKQYARQDAAWSEVVIPEAPEFVETDPTVPDHVKSITTTNISHWNTAWDEATEANGWGNHADAGYATEAWVNDKGYSSYTGSDAVKTSGNQSIAGTKTFSSHVQISGMNELAFNTYGGGWNMADTTWVRSTGGKAVYVANTTNNAVAVAGDVCAFYSDVRLKDVKGQIENPLDKVDAIETFYYTHNDIAKELGYEGDEVQVGVSAQSVKAVMPEVVTRAPVDMDADGGSLTGENYMTVKYDRLVPLLLESVKELTARVKELESGN